MHGRRKISLEYLEQERKMNIFKNVISLEVPILLIHGDKDPFVDYHNSVKIHKHNKNTKLLIIENENHGFKKDDNNLKYACSKTLEFIKKEE